MKRSRISNEKRYEWDSSKVGAFVEEFTKGTKNLEDLKIKRVFNLHPPIKGFGRGGKKAPFKLKGAFGYHGAAINQLLQRMI